MARRKSRAEAAIEAQLQTLDPKSKRYEVLSAARDFKSAWVALGDKLTTVRENNAWRDWGYDDFESYCRRELHVRRDTANKLTRSYAFLRDHVPDRLENREDRELPTLDVVDLLTQAPERTSLNNRQISAIRDEVFEPEAPPSRSQVVKRFRELDPEAFKATTKPRTLPDPDLRKALLLAERLQSLLEVQPGITAGAVSGVREAVGELRTLFEESRERQSA